MMVAVTPTWAIPYAESTDPFCDGCTITESMAERIDAILADFDASLSGASVQPLARASTFTTQSDVDTGELVYTAIDFDTTGIADLNQPTAPIIVSDDSRYIMGAYIRLDDGPSSGVIGIQVASVQGGLAPPFMGYRQRAQGGTGSDTMGSTSYIAVPNSQTDRIYANGPPASRVLESYIWAWRIGANT